MWFANLTPGDRTRDSVDDAEGGMWLWRPDPTLRTLAFRRRVFLPHPRLVCQPDDPRRLYMRNSVDQCLASGFITRVMAS